MSKAWKPALKLTTKRGIYTEDFKRHKGIHHYFTISRRTNVGSLPIN